MNTHVDFETAKLLKEKRFDERTEKRYGTHSGILYSDAVINDLEDDVFTAAPSIAQLVMWLYEKHGIWIIVTPLPYSDHLTHWRWEHKSTNYATRSLHWKKEQDYMSPTEAYQEAIKYCLTNLIK